MCTHEQRKRVHTRMRAKNRERWHEIRFPVSRSAVTAPTCVSVSISVSMSIYVPLCGYGAVCTDGAVCTGVRVHVCVRVRACACAASVNRSLRLQRS